MSIREKFPLIKLWLKSISVRRSPDFEKYDELADKFLKISKEVLKAEPNGRTEYFSDIKSRFAADQAAEIARAKHENMSSKRKRYARVDGPDGNSESVRRKITKVGVVRSIGTGLIVVGGGLSMYGITGSLDNSGAGVLVDSSQDQLSFNQEHSVALVISGGAVAISGLGSVLVSERLARKGFHSFER